MSSVSTHATLHDADCSNTSIADADASASAWYADALVMAAMAVALADRASVCSAAAASSYCRFVGRADEPDLRLFRLMRPSFTLTRPPFELTRPLLRPRVPPLPASASVSCAPVSRAAVVFASAKKSAARAELLKARASDSCAPQSEAFACESAERASSSRRLLACSGTNKKNNRSECGQHEKSAG
eukprot:6176310-Pleurochrysis_carterae.AAC.3